ncbi:MAG: type II/IV secretion system ATPase subunit [Chloroflexi bacterium]|nr:type II/IV secretion system ATPase subunit [Chloroflexota bacterium]
MALPFPVEAKAEDCSSACSVRSLLPDELQEVSEEIPHLMQYLHQVPIKDMGVPEYYEKIDRKLADVEQKNLIYRVDKNLFVHIFADPEDARDFYISIEPAMLENIKSILEDLEQRLLDYVEELSAAETEEDKAEVLLRAVEENTVVTDGDGSEGKAGSSRKGRGLLGFFSKSASTPSGPIKVTQSQQAALKYILVRDKLRMGALEPLLQDENIEDISCSGLGTLFIEHKVFDGLKSNISFDTHEELDDFVLRLAERIGKPVTYRSPIVDATLLDGSRINIVFGADVSRSGSNFTIRKFQATPISLVDLINFGAIDFTLAAYLSMMAAEGMNIFVSGETASGKTTLLNALAAFVPPESKIVSIEDTPEFQVPHPNWIREVVRGSLGADDGGVTMFSLLKAALRQRPNLIVIGEIRGEEGLIAFQAMQTGHPVMATFHASTVEKLIQRLTGSPINVPKVYIDNLNVAVIASAVRLPNGKPGRRIISVNELVGYDKASDSFAFVESFRWNSATDVHEFTGNLNSYLLENQLAPKRGYSPENKRAIYKDLQRRASLFERLQDQGVTDFYELYRVFAKAQREGLV